jgi:hypothetical protein
MIVDDRIVIMGSGNLTDRSLVGYQDSEVLPSLSLLLVLLTLPFHCSDRGEN